MMKRRYWVSVPVLVVVALVVVHDWPKQQQVRPVIPGLAAAEQAAQREAANRLARMAAPSALAHGRVGKFSTAAIESAEDRFRHMLAVRGLITQDKERRILAQQILATPDGRDLMREILVAPGFASAAFGSFQAEARFYAATVLDEAAQHGQLDFVVDTAAELANQLAASAGEPDRGRSEDLMDIAAAIGRNVGSKLTDPNSPVLAKLGFVSGMSKPVRQLYIRGLFQGIWKAEGFENAQTAMGRLGTL